MPIVGWDVAFTNEGIFLLEVNLSCNFFRGGVDIPSYIDFVDGFFLDLEKREGGGSSSKTKKVEVRQGATTNTKKKQ